METKSMAIATHGPDINVSAGERIVSAFAGGALAAYGTRRRDTAGTLLAVAGGLLIWRAGTGRSFVYQGIGVNTADPEHKSVHAAEVITINVPPSRVYEFWRNFENLPRIMQNLEYVHTQPDGTSEWCAKGPAGTTFAWRAEITDDVPDRRIAWRSTGDAVVPNSGAVELRPAAGDRGTVVQVRIDYQPPAGKAGQAIASLMMSTPEQEIREDLRRLKQLLETGEIPTTDGQSAGPRGSMFSFLSRIAQ
jgi:uncharacterized membrane protein